MVVWHLEYGETPTVVEFDRDEAAQIRIRTNCPADIQQYKNGLARIYYAPYSWRSGVMRFRQIAGTLAKIRTLAALEVNVKIYYKYHIDQATYILANMVPKRAEAYMAGSLLGDELSLEFIEAEPPYVLPGILYNIKGLLYGNLG